MRSRLFLLLGILTAAVSLVYGQTTDPATLEMGSGVNCPRGCNNNGGEPNLLGATATIDIYQNQNGNQPAITSGNLLLILAVPNGQDAPSTTITESDYDSSRTLTDTGAATLISNSTTFSSSNSGDVYSALALNGGDNSNNWTNLSGHESDSGLSNVQGFTLYEYKMTSSSLVSNGYAQFVFGSDLPLGTYAMAYGCDTTFGTLGNQSGCLDNKKAGFSNGDTYTTPFTHAGLVNDAPVTPTPEPADAIFLATIVIACGWLLQRNRAASPK